MAQQNCCGAGDRCKGLGGGPGRGWDAWFRTSRAAQGPASVGTTRQEAQGLPQGILDRNTREVAESLLGQRGRAGCGQSHSFVGIKERRSRALPHRRGREHTGCPENPHPFPGGDSEPMQGMFTELWFPKCCAHARKKYEYVFEVGPIGT